MKSLPLSFLIAFAALCGDEFSGAIAQPTTTYVLGVETNGQKYAVPGFKDMSFEDCDKLAKAVAAKAAEQHLTGTVACVPRSVNREQS